MDRQLSYAETCRRRAVSARTTGTSFCQSAKGAGAHLATRPERNLMSGKLGGKIALVTGGTAGIGLATAQRFVKEGAYVFVTGRRQTELDLAAKLMSGHVTAVKAGASNLDYLDKLFAQIKREKGRLDVVYANAGGGCFAPIGGITEEHFDQTFDTNAKGTLVTVQKALPLVSDGGWIFNTASTTGFSALCALCLLFCA